jgi:hypothetical protein
LRNRKSGQSVFKDEFSFFHIYWLLLFKKKIPILKNIHFIFLKIDHSLIKLMNLGTSLGFHTFWGFSPGFDLSNISCDDSEQASEPINVLIVDPGDIRHIIHTVAKRYRRDSTRPIHFYLLEKHIEVLARNLLLLEILMDYQIPIRQVILQL